jgi:hypothetical protein
MRAIKALLITAAVMCGASAVASAEECPCAPAVAGPKEIRPDGAPIVLEPGLGTLFKMPLAGGSVFMSNDVVADVAVRPMLGSNDLISVHAKKPGTAVLYAVDGDGRVLLSRVVEVPSGPAPIMVRVMRGQKTDIWRPLPQQEPESSAPDHSVEPTNPTISASAQTTPR